MIIREFRGITDLVIAEVTEDTVENFTTGTPEEFAGASELSRTTETSSETHYYNNIPAVVIEGTGADTVTISASALPLDLLAKITGQYHDEATGMMVECERTTKYFAIGYKTEMTDGTPIFVWRLKGTFGIPDSTHVTKDNGTGANGQSVTYTGISTTHKFTKTGKEAKAVVVEISGDSEVLLNACIPTTHVPFGTFLNVAVTVPSLRFSFL